MLYITLFLLSLILTYLIRQYAEKKAILDIPNDRSSHITPIPRGGGLGIVVLFFTTLIYFKSSIDTPLFYALLSTIPIAIISLIDDIITISSRLRILVQSLSAILALYALGGVNNIDFIYFELHGIWLNIIAFIAIIWLTNLYNFLDGIDGYAGSQAITVGLGIFLFFNSFLGLVIVAISLGFLVFNWHKASIFMGDVGSTTLGFIFAIFILYYREGGDIFLSMVLLSLFWFDATITLIRKFRNREKLTQAHKKHAYQRLVQSGWSHSKVTLFALAFNSIFLFLLYIVPNISTVFVINILSLYIILKFIDRKRAFK
ncbi:MAG: glycosyltransferase family 4 protein [Sulfurovum sp.]